MTIWNNRTNRPAAKSRRSFRRQKVNRELTATKYFLDKRSFCNLAGESFLFGADMEVMHHAVIVRDKFCCVECGRSSPLQVHHKKTRGQGGSDDAANLISLCAVCHAKKHPQVQFSGG